MTESALTPRGSCSLQPISSRLLRRFEAAHYISEKHFPCSPKTLAKLAVVGGSPPFRKAGRIPLYAVSDLDQWALEKLGPRVSSTAELRQATSRAA